MYRHHTKIVSGIIALLLFVVFVGQVAAKQSNATVLADFTPRDIDVEIRGSGSSLPEPVYNEFIVDYRGVAGNVDVRYRTVDNKEGLENLVLRNDHFAATDVIQESDVLEDDHLYVPMMLAPIVITYNNDSLELDSTTLRFSADTLARIFRGDITNWNDEAIADENRNVTLPDKEITVVYHINESGSSSILTTYLDQIDPSHFEPTASFEPEAKRSGANGDSEAAVTIKTTDGAIGYVAYNYAKGKNLPLSWIQNPSEKWIRPSLASTAFAARDVAYPSDLRVDIVNSSFEYAYPLAGFTWLVIKRDDYDEPEPAQAVTDFIYWTLQEEQRTKALKLWYAPIPNEAYDRAIEQLEKVRVNDEQVFIKP